MIDPRHDIPLTTAISASAQGRGSVVQSLYRECMSLYKNEGTKTSTVTKQRSVLPAKNGQHITAVVTDNDSGLFVQLTGLVSAEGEHKDGPYLTFGKKFLEESKNPQLSNTAVRLWR